MKKIKLTQEKIAFVDDEYYEILNKFKWCAYWDRWNWYALRNSSFINGKRKKIWMHREIMAAPKGIQVDHRNGDGLDNRKENLRLCNNQQNQRNKINANKNNKLKIKGVCWDNSKKKFQAYIGVNGKAIHLGFFNVLGDADSAYRIAEEKYFDDFVRIYK